MKTKKDILEVFEQSPNRAFEVVDIVERLKIDPKLIYNTLQRLVREDKIVKAWPGLNGGRKCSYFLKNYCRINNQQN